MSDVTRILQSIDQGDPRSSQELLPLVYDELRKLAAARMAHEKPGGTLSATSLVHEAYVRLVDGSEQQRWENRRHFFAAAATAMRRILIEAARARQAEKHGGGHDRLAFHDLPVVFPQTVDSLLDLDEALTALQQADPESALLIELRYFSGHTMEEAAEILGISVRKAHYQWDYARAWLKRRLKAEG